MEKGDKMAKNDDKPKINIDGEDYNLDDLSDKAKEFLANVQFVDAQLLQLNNELAVADTARIGYSNALNAELSKAK